MTKKCTQISPRYVAAQSDLQLHLRCFQVAFECVDGSDSKPQLFHGRVPRPGTVGGVFQNYVHPFVVDNRQSFHSVLRQILTHKIFPRYFPARKFLFIFKNWLSSWNLLLCIQRSLCSRPMLPFTFQTSIELRILNLLSNEIQKTIIKGHTLTTWIPTPKYHNSVLDFIQHRKNTWLLYPSCRIRITRCLLGRVFSKVFSWQ